MSLAWLLPAGLTALAAWLLPLLIHLARRSEHRVTLFAALRWLTARPRPRRRIRFDDWPLLIVRLLLIAAIAALLARPVLSGTPDRRPWLVAVPPVGAAQARAASSEPETQLHWLESGFPMISAAVDEATRLRKVTGTAANASADPAAPVISLLRELDASLPANTPLTVLVPATLEGADAERPRLRRRVDWVIVPDAGTDTPPAATAPALPASPTLDLRSDAGHRTSLRYLRAAAFAWQRSGSSGNDADSGDKAHSDGDGDSNVDHDVVAGTTDEPIVASPSAASPASTPASGPPPSTASTPSVVSISALEAAPPATARRLVWLASKPLPEAIWNWIAAGGVVLIADDTPVIRDSSAGGGAPAAASSVVWRDGDGAPLARSWRHGRGRVLQLSRPLRPEAMPLLLDTRFPEQLRTLLVGPPQPPARVDAASHAPTLGGRAYTDLPRPLTTWLILVITLLWALERWMAATRPRGVAA